MGLLTTRRPRAAPFNPDNVTSIAAGEYWIPGVGETDYGETTFSWAGQRGKSNFVQTATSAQPDQTTDNGNRTWDFVQANNDNIAVVSPDSDLLDTGAIWFAYWCSTTADSNFRLMVEHSLTGASNWRWWFRKRNAAQAFQIQYSSDGTTASDSRFNMADAGNLHHYIVAIDPSASTDDEKVRLFQDLIPIRAASHPSSGGSTINAGTNPLRLGTISTGAQDLNGKIGGMVAYGVGALPGYVELEAIRGLNAPVAVPGISRRTRIVCAGNSVTYGTGAATGSLGAYPQQLQDLLRDTYGLYEVINVGVGGATTQDVIDAFDSTVQPEYRPGYGRNILIFFEFRNEIGGGLSAAQAFAQTQALCELAASRSNWEIWVCTAPPTAEAYQSTIDDANTLLRAGYSSFADVLVDLDAIPELTPAGSSANPTYYDDTTHLEDEGYALLAAAVHAAL